MALASNDGDLIAHMAASAGEQRYIEAELPDGTLEIFDNRTALKEYCKITDIDYKQCKIEDQQFPEPIENVLHTAKMMIETWTSKANCDDFEVYVGFGECFRHDMLLPERYKANRENSIKAVHVDAVKEWILDKSFGIEATENLESDDWLSIRQYEGFQKWKKTKDDKDIIVAVTRDKDARSQTGWLYNPDDMDEPRLVYGLGGTVANKRGTQWTIKGYGSKYLMAQMLTSDPVDNLFPSRLSGKRFGALKTHKLLDECDTSQEAWFATANKYKEWFGDDFQYTAWNGEVVNTDWLGVMQMYFDAFRMKRWVGDDLQIKTVLEGYDYEC